MFPLAHRATHSSTYQNFCIEDYITTNVTRIGIFIGSSTDQSQYWWLRSSSLNYHTNGHSVNYGGTIEGTGNGPYSLGVRPAMVMKLA